MSSRIAKQQQRMQRFHQYNLEIITTCSSVQTLTTVDEYGKFIKQWKVAHS
jgi:hypothetical protein